MSTQSEPNLYTAGLALASSVIATIFGYFLNSRKTKAEIAKLKAETDKIIVETQSISLKVNTALAPANFDAIYYDWSAPTGFDFQVEKSKEYDDKDKKEFGVKGEGRFEIKNNVINIDRTNMEGRFGLLLKSYTIDNEQRSFIEKNPLMSQQRKIQISCEVKSLNEKRHQLDFVLRDTDSFSWLAKETINIEKNQWTPINAYLRVAPDKDFYLKIYDRHVEAPSSIQIKNLSLIEKF